MRVVPVPVKGKFVKIKVPSELKDITLRQKCEFVELSEALLSSEADIEIFIGELQDRRFTLDMEGAELSKSEEEDWEIRELELRLDRSEKIRDQILAVTPKSQHNKIKSLDEISLEFLKRAILIVDQKDVAMISSFVLPDATIPDITRLEEKKESLNPKVHEKEIAEIDIKISKLKKGEFICLPAANVIFEAKMASDKVIEKYPKMPEDLVKILEEMDMTVQEFLQQSHEGLNPEELKQRTVSLKMIKEHFTRFKSGKIRSAANLLSHVCVPYGEQYDYSLAQERAEYFLDLNMETVEGLLAFFLIVSQSSTKNLQNYSKEMTGLISLNAQLNSREIGVGLQLSDWFYAHLLEKQKTNSSEKPPVVSTSNS